MNIATPLGPGRPDLLVRAEGLVKKYGSFVAVDGIDFSVARGEFCGLLGRNGAGKSTTMRMIACVSAATAGSLHVLGRDPVTCGSGIRARIGMVHQDDNLDVELTVRENLYVYGRYFGLGRAVLRSRIGELLSFARLAERADDRVEDLSGGMRRRLAVARALVNDPELMLLDEPTTGLDPQARHELWERLHSLRRKGVTLLLTTHYMDEAEQLCSRIVVLDGGRVVECGSPAELIRRHSTPEVVEVRPSDSGSPHDIAEMLLSTCERAEVLPDRVLLYAASGNGTAEAVARSGLPVDSVLVRRASLEDVFLRLTGRGLED